VRGAFLSGFPSSRCQVCVVVCVRVRVASVCECEIAAGALAHVHSAALRRTVFAAGYAAPRPARWSATQH
jgi:hypothetical protein